MAYHKQIFPDRRTENSGRLAKYNADLDKYISDRIEAAVTEFYEIEALEVTEISKEVYGGVKGVFIDEDSQTVKGFGRDEDIILCLKPNFTQIPLVGEHISVIEFNNKHYYMDIINRQNSPNENALAGTSDYDELKKYGDTFTRNNNVKHIDISEGDIVFNGRFNNSITLGSNGANKPITKIVVGHRVVEDNLFKQTIDRDDASIYLISDEASTTLDGQRISGKKVLIKSDGIFISSNDVRLGSSVENDLEPVVKGNELKKIIDLLLDSAISTKQAEVVTKLAASGGTPTPETIQLGTEITELESIKASPVTQYLSDKVKTS